MYRKKTIALDLDGVVFDSENLYRVYAEMYDTDVLKSDNLIDNTQRTFQKRYAWPSEHFQRFYDKHASAILKSSSFMPGFDIVIPKLLKKYNFIIVTARNDCEIEFAKEKFHQIGLNNIRIYNNELSKIDCFLEHDVDFVIDDDSEICLAAAKNDIWALYFKNNASLKEKHDKIINVNNWGEIYKFLILESKE